MIEDILTPLVCERYLSDAHYRAGHANILKPKPGTRILGLHTPEMKKVAKDFSKRDDSGSILDRFEKEQSSFDGLVQPLTHDERMVWGLLIDYIKCPLDERLSRIDAFLSCMDNWAICDNFCCNSAWAKRCDKTVLWQYLEKLSHSDDEFTVRVSLVLSMVHFLDDENIEKTFSLIDGIGLMEGEPYYIRMAVAWLLATALYKQKEATYAYLARTDLPADILKLYARKVRESRVTRDWNPFKPSE